MLWLGAGQRDTSSEHSVLQPSVSISQHSLACAQTLVALSFSGSWKVIDPLLPLWYISPP